MPEIVCIHCDEPIPPGERVVPSSGMNAHFECGMRMLFGGANHLLMQCSCCGGTLDPDPANLSRRMAAKVAAAIFMTMKVS